MASNLVFTTNESTTRTQTQTFSVPGFKTGNKVTANTGIVEVTSVNGDNVTVKMSGGSVSNSSSGGSAANTITGYSMDAPYEGASKSVSTTPSHPGYSGTLSLVAGSRYTGTGGVERASYSGTISKPDTRYTNYYYAYIVTFELNVAPTLVLDTTDARTLYENDTYTIGGATTDTDVGNVVNTYYQINSGAIRAITTAISSGAAIPFNKVLTFKNGAFYEGVTLLPEVLAVGAQHVLKVWAEDNQGGKSAEIIRTFYVVPNRPASLVISPFTTSNDLINTDKITISGTVTDLDGNSLIVKYKIANGSYIQVYSGTGGAVSFQIPLSALSVGANTVTIQAVDSYGSITSKTLNIVKTEKDNPLLTSVVRYKLTPPNSTAKGVLLWIQRESGDLVVGAEISMGSAENFVPMSKISTAFVSVGIEEDEFKFENTVAVENIILKLTMTRANATSDKGIKLISGVLS